MAVDVDILRQIEKPGRYIGGEVNQIKKDLRKVEVKVGLSYPDVYEIGMSHIGLKILYETLNKRPEVAAERVYAPWPDFEAALRTNQRKLSTLENGIPLHELDVLGFTLQYELSYSNLLNVLDLGGIPLRAKDRTPDHPVVIGGGPTSYNPEPLSAIVDAICLGDAEELIHEVVDASVLSKRKRESRLDLWLRLSQIQGVYVPGLYDVRYNEDGTVAAIIPRHGAPARVRKRILMNLDQAPYFTADLVPNIGIVHDRYGVEVQRGCMRGCRFCQAGYIYRPERQRSPETIRKLVRQGIQRTGTEEYSLLSLSLGDYNCIEPLLLSLMDEHEDKKAAISTPSMRLESVTPAIMDQISRVRKTSFTVAPEAGSNRMRAVINKVIDENVLIEMVAQLFSRGWTSLKLYFMLGLPTETQDDLQAIIDLGARCRQTAKRFNSSPTITVNVSSFVPKPHTPFQWSPQVTLEEIREKQHFMLGEAKRAKLNFRCHESGSSVMEGVFSRGDRRTGEALIRGYELGARMDGWQEHHSLKLWDQALSEVGLDRSFYNLRRRDAEELFPWDHIDPGVKKEWLWEDWMHALEQGGVADCSESPCYDCGVCDHKVVHNVVYGADDPTVKPRHRVKKKYIARSMEELVHLPAKPKPKEPKEPKAAPEQATPAAESAAPIQGPLPRSALEGAVEAINAKNEQAPRRDEPAKPEDYDHTFDLRLPFELRTRIRLRFAKRGLQAMTSHLEVMQAFSRAMRRANVPVIFSLGMHPRMRASMSPPMPLGSLSEHEYFDIEVKRPYTAETLLRALEHELPEGIVPLEATEIPISAPAISAILETITWRIEAPTAEAHASALTHHVMGSGRTLEISAKRRRRTLSLDDHVVSILEAGPRAIEVTLHAQVTGRVREVLKGALGTDPFAAGWTVTKIGVRTGALKEACPTDETRPEPPQAQV
ncbi:MAG: TIGR03960 family B12-binding radical SAM protein [Myxococcota bacterium]